MNVMKMELKKGLHNKFFLAALLIMTLVAVLSASYIIEAYHESLSLFNSISEDGSFKKNFLFQVMSSYSSWIGTEGRSLMQSLFYILIPVAAVLPFGTSFLTERKTGYHRNIAVRANMRFFYFAKSLSCFVTGFLVVVIPLILNFFIVSAVIPSSTPHINYDIYYVIYYGELFADLFYSQPLLYIILFIIVDGVFAGAISLMAFALSTKLINKYVVLFLPVLFFLGVDYLASFVLRNVDGNTWGYEFSLISLLHGNSPRGAKLWWMVLAQFLLLFGISVYALVKRSKKDEIY